MRVQVLFIPTTRNFLSENEKYPQIFFLDFKGTSCRTFQVITLVISCSVMNKEEREKTRKIGQLKNINGKKSPYSAIHKFTYPHTGIYLFIYLPEYIIHWGPI
jgi:hypothetical protein